MTALDPLEHAWAWHGSAAWRRDADGYRAWRIPPEDFAPFDPPELIEKASMAAGVRLAVITDASAVDVDLVGRDDEVRPLDVVVDGVLAFRETPRGPASFRMDLPEGSHRVEVWIPHFGQVAVGSVRLVGATTVEPVPAAPRWLVYGSSISHSRGADGPSATWAAQVDRALGWSHTNLGLGGQCHLDPPVRRVIERADVDLILACIGINMYQVATFGPRGLAPQIGGFLTDVLHAHPGVPLVVVSPIPSPSREDDPNADGLTLADVRTTVEEVRAQLASRFPRVTGISGPELLRFDEAERLLPDGLHPGQEGMNVIAERLAPRLAAAAATASTM